MKMIRNQRLREKYGNERSMKEFELVEQSALSFQESKGRVRDRMRGK